MNHEQKQIVINEHFWFTATIIGINGIAFSQVDKIHLSIWFILVLTGLNLFAIHLVIDRSSAYAMGDNLSHLKKPKADFSNKGYWLVIKERAKLTFNEFKQSLKHIPYIIAEVGSSLFYLLLIISTFISVFYAYYNQHCCCCR